MTDAPDSHRSSTFRFPLLFLGALVLVVLASWLYSRGVRRSDAPQNVPTEASAPQPEELHANLRGGLQALQAGRTEEALALFRAVPRDDPSYPLALQSIAKLHRGNEEREASVAILEELAGLQPENPEVYLLLGTGLFRLDRFAEAELAALRAIELAPSRPDARYLVALFRTAQGQIGRAVQTYNRAIAADPRGTRLGQAREELRELGRTRPDLAAPHYLLAFLASRIGDVSEERSELELFLELEPEGSASEVARKQLAGLDSAPPTGP